jgi:hypothetical protein
MLYQAPGVGDIAVDRTIHRTIGSGLLGGQMCDAVMSAIFGIG